MMLPNLLAFVLRAQWKQLFQFRNTLRVVGRGLYLAVVLLYAVGFGYILQNAAQFRLSTEFLLNGLNTAIVVLTFAKSYFPAYQTTSQPIASFYPLRRAQKMLLGFLTDMLSVFPLAMLTFYMVAFSMAFSSLTLFQMVSSLLMFLTALILDRSLRLVIEYAVWLRWLYGACVLATAAALVGQTWILKFVQIPSAVFDSALCAAACILQALLAWQSVLPSTERTSGAPSGSSGTVGNISHVGYILRAFFRSKHVIILFGVVVLLKIMMLVLLVKPGRQDTNEILHVNIAWIFAAPIAWFTYVLNNTFGMNWHLWQTLQQRQASTSKMFRFFATCTALPVSLDAFLTFSALWYFQRLEMVIIVNWLSCAVSLFCWGWIITVTSPIKVEKLTSSVFMSLRSVSPTVGIVGVFALLVVLTIASSVHHLLPLLLPVLAVVGAAYTFSRYSTLKYRTYNRIHE